MKKIAVIVRNSRQFNALRDEAIRRNYQWASGVEGVDKLKYKPDDSGYEYFVFDPERTVRYDGLDADLNGCVKIEFEQWSMLTGVMLPQKITIDIGGKTAIDIGEFGVEEIAKIYTSRDGCVQTIGYLKFGQIEDIYAACKSFNQ